MKLVPLRYLADICPPTPDFDALDDDDQVGFLPLDAVWSDERADHGRRVTKAQVAVGYSRYQTGDVLCPKVTPTFQAGRAMIARSVGAGTTELHVLRPQEGVDPRWVAYALRSKHFLDEGVTAFQGVAGLQRVPPEFVASFHVLDRAPDEQRRIADFLDDRVARIDQIIAARRAQIQLVEDAANGYADEVLERTLSEGPSTRLGRFITRIEQGWSPQCSAIPAEADEWGVLKVSAVRPGRFLETENKALPIEEPPRREFEVKAGDLLITRANTPKLVGACAVVPHPVRPRLILSDKIMRIALAPLIHPPFIAVVAQTARARTALSLAGTGTSDSMVNIRGEDIRNLAVPILAGPQQQALALAHEYQREVAARRVEMLLAQIAALTDYKQSLITAAVTGELDVTTAGSGVPG